MSVLSVAFFLFYYPFDYPIFDRILFVYISFVLSLYIFASLEYTRSVRKVSSHFEYLENRSRGLGAAWQPVREDLTVHP